MNQFSQKRKIDIEVSKRKKYLLRKEKFLLVFKRYFGLLKYLFFFLILVFLLFYSPFFLIKNIEVNTLKYIDENEIRYNFEPLVGENFFLTDLSNLRTEVIMKYAFIGNIYTEKLFPNTIIVHVREKEPFAVVSNNVGYFLLDSTGFVLLEGDGNSLKTNYSVKEIIGEDLNNIDFTVNTQSNFYNIEKIYDIVNILDYYGYKVRIVEIDGHKAEFFIYDNTSFIFSFLEEIDLQLKRFIIVKRKIDLDNLVFKSIDMRYQRPVLIEK